MPLSEPTHALGDIRETDVLVIGAGPAGGATAYLAARGGAAVCLVDRAVFPRRKVCGACLNSAALSALDRMGLGSRLRRLGPVTLDRLRIGHGWRSVVLPLPPGAAVAREVLDATLASAAMDAGASFLQGVTATIGRVVGDRRLVELARGVERVTVGARLVVAASGLGTFRQSRSHLPRVETARDSRIGAGCVAEAVEEYEPGVIHMAVGRGGYVGVTRLEDGRANVAAAFDRWAVREAGSPAEAARRILETAGFPPLPEGTEWKGTPALTRRVDRPAAESLFLIGDAAGYVEPFTGEGMSTALRSAEALAPLIAGALRDPRADYAAEWGAEHHRLFVRRGHTCRIVARLLRSPTGTPAAFGLLRLAPRVAWPLIRGVNVGDVPRGVAAACG